MGQLHREPPPANPSGRPPAATRQSNRPRLESPQMGQLNKPLPGRDNPDATKNGPPPSP
jgi:hypothetical protein